MNLTPYLLNNSKRPYVLLNQLFSNFYRLQEYYSLYTDLVESNY